MKKLLTIALALVMVLALAAPAMATVGFGPAAEAEAATKTEFTVKIRALEFVPATAGFTFENNYYADYDPTKGIVAGSDIRFVVDVTFPKYGDVSAADEFEKYDDNMNLVVSGNNLAFGWINTGYTLSVINSTSTGHEYFNGSLPRVTTNSATKVVKYMTLADYNVTATTPWYIADNRVNTVYYSFGSQKNFDDAVPMGLSKTATTTYSFMFVADVLNTADVTVTAAIDATGYADQFAKNKEYSFIYNSKKYTVKHTANSDGTNYFDMWNRSDPRNVVRFTTDSKDQITNVAVSVDSMVSMSYTSVTPLTYAELQTVGNIVAGIKAGTDPKLVEAENALRYIAAAKKAILDGMVASNSNDKLTVTDCYWLNQVTTVKNAKKDWATGSNITLASFTNAFDDADDDIVTLADAKALMTTAGQALVTYTVATKVATCTDAVAWQNLKVLYEAYEDLVIGVPGDQIASAITGVPTVVTYTDACVPFLGWLGDASMNHGQWWNVNKDVRLSEIVFNLNDKVHTNGYVQNPAGASKIVAKYAPDTNTHDTLNQVRYSWCATGAFALTDIYGEAVNLYDAKNVTASKDVNLVQYNKLYPVFKEMMTVLGFEWDGTTAYMYRAAFVEKFGGKLYNEASYTYAAYTSALVVADPNAQPPQTGDTTSILGFVMIAVAVLAAGAVVVKKVRA